jgi:hypothetical protein
MRHTIFLMLAGLALAGCAETGRSGFEARMGGLVGAPETELRARMGTPAYDHTHAGRRSIAYTDAWTEILRRPEGGWIEVSRLCEVVFAMADGRVAGFRTRGDGCGWAGRENFPAKV